MVRDHSDLVFPSSNCIGSTSFGVHVANYSSWFSEALTKTEKKKGHYRQLAVYIPTPKGFALTQRRIDHVTMKMASAQLVSC